MTGFLKKQWPLVGLVLLLALVALYLTGSGKEIIQRTVVKEIVQGEGLKLKDIHYTHEDPDKGVKWVLDASEVLFSQDKSSFLFHNFELKVEPENKPWFRLTGKKGNYFRDSGELDLRGDLNGNSANGYRFVGEHMLLNERRGHLSTDKPIRIFGPFFYVTGRGMVADLRNERLRILSNVTTVLDREALYK